MAEYAKLNVGDEVLIVGYNMKNPYQTWIDKVGRTLYTVRYYSRDTKFRIDDRVANDNYGHIWILTPEELADRKAHSELLNLVRNYNSRNLSLLSNDQLLAIVKIFKEEK